MIIRTKVVFLTTCVSEVCKLIDGSMQLGLVVKKKIIQAKLSSSTGGQQE